MSLTRMLQKYRKSAAAWTASTDGWRFQSVKKDGKKFDQSAVPLAEAMEKMQKTPGAYKLYGPNYSVFFPGLPAKKVRDAYVFSLNHYAMKNAKGKFVPTVETAYTTISVNNDFLEQAVHAVETAYESLLTVNGADVARHTYLARYALAFAKPGTPLTLRLRSSKTKQEYTVTVTPEVRAPLYPDFDYAKAVQESRTLDKKHTPGNVLGVLNQVYDPFGPGGHHNVSPHLRLCCRRWDCRGDDKSGL